MGAFEDFVNSNLGIRQPFISDFAPPTGDAKSSKAAGIRGSKFLDLSSNFLYEKTGENNNTDWVKIAELGEPRGGSATNLAGDQYIQFISGSVLVGSENFIYQYDLGRVSGTSGYYQDLDGISGHLSDELIVGDLAQDNFVTISGSSMEVDGTLTVNSSLHNQLVPTRGGQVTLGTTPSIKSKGLTIGRLGVGMYRLWFSGFTYSSVSDYQVVCSTSDLFNSFSSSSLSHVEVKKSTQYIDVFIADQNGQGLDSGFLSVLIYEF
jgi:hypothetical protein